MALSIPLKKRYKWGRSVFRLFHSKRFPAFLSLPCKTPTMTFCYDGKRTVVDYYRSEWIGHASQGKRFKEAIFKTSSVSQLTLFLESVVGNTLKSFVPFVARPRVLAQSIIKFLFLKGKGEETRNCLEMVETTGRGGDGFLLHHRKGWHAKWSNKTIQSNNMSRKVVCVCVSRWNAANLSPGRKYFWGFSISFFCFCFIQSTIHHEHNISYRRLPYLFVGKEFSFKGALTQTSHRSKKTACYVGYLWHTISEQKPDWLWL